jgi:hypothetical protein
VIVDSFFSEMTNAGLRDVHRACLQPRRQTRLEPLAGSGRAGSAGLPAERASGIAESFAEARDAFEVAWRAFLARRTEADFEEYRRDRAFHAWKQAKGLKLPTQVADGRSTCFCGAAIGIADMDAHVYSAHIEPETACAPQG